MNDIAAEAGIVRQTLYNIFANKDEVLRGTIRRHVEEATATVRREWKYVEALGPRLDVVFDHTVVKPFETIRAMPEAGDVIDGFNDATKQEAARAGELYRKLYEEAFAPHRHAIANNGLSPLQLADCARHAAAGFKRDAESKDHLLDLLATLKVLILAAANGL